MSVHVIRATAAALLLTLTLGAQSARKPARSRTPAPPKQVVADPTRPFPLLKVSVTGNQQMTDTEIVRLSGLAAGKEVTRADFEAAQAKLLETGLFKTVAYRYAPVAGSTGYAATLEVSEIEQLYPYRFDALDVPEAELRAYLRKQQPLFGEKIPPTKPVLDAFRSSVEQFLSDRNRTVEVAAKVLPDLKGNMEVVFQPDRLPSVAQVKFAGNKEISTASLQQAVSGAAIGALYTPGRFQQILDASVRPQYEQRGFLNVKFPKLEAEDAKDVRGLQITVHVEEGGQYKLRSVQLAGELSDNKSLMKEGGFREGEVADMKAVQDGADRVKKALKRRGYLSADATVSRKLDTSERAADVTVTLEPGPQYRMGKLTIDGLDITTEPHIRDMWALKEKQPFDAEYPDIFLSEMPNVLDNLGRTRSTITPDPGTLTVDVLLTFVPPEKKPKGPMDRPDPGRTGRGPVQFP